MPQLQEYVNRENIAPTDRGTEARVQEGRRVGAAYNQVAESLRDFGNRTGQQIGSAIRDAGEAAYQYQNHRQLNQGIDTYWPLRGGLESDWDDTVKGNPDKGIPPADPHDPAIAQRFMEEKVKPTLQKWGDTFTTEGAQNWARGRIDSLIGHFQERTAADMGTVAKKQIDTANQTMVNTAVNSAYNDPSPSNIKNLTQDLKASYGGMIASSPYLKGADAARALDELPQKAIEQITKAGMLGDIHKSPDPEKTSADRLKDPNNVKYLTPADQESVRTHARSEARAIRVDQTYQDHQQKVQRDDISDNISRDYEKKLFSDDPKEQAKVSTRAIYNDDRITRRDADHLRTIIEQETKPKAEARISSKTSMELLGDIRSGKIINDDPIYDAYGKGKLTRADFTFLRKERDELKTDQGQKLSQDRTDFFKKFSSSIDIGKNAQGMPSELGQQRTYAAEQDARRQEAVLREAKKDPHLVYDSRSEYFFGQPENLRKYQPTLKEIMDYEAGLKKGGAVAPAGPQFKPFIEQNATFNQRFGFDPAATVNVTSPKVNDVQRGYKFKGGDPSRPDSWEKVR